MIPVTFNHVKGFSKLTLEQKQLFRRVYNSHLKMMGNEARMKYLPEQLKEVKWVQQENCLHVFWKGDTDWFHYDTRGCWY
ncbi:hypothetical protein AWH56_005415 [Anaerobacillus isosaccharinicus]|uniref:Uncharacterized protein n=1 Tax=Anaerobacillus isosaccharinicus TaxID=1532552 RepID=A0A1S2M834_9BACI|nr:hypothetical protein [Anaerobacillus isosaccharinicus]MBA5584536.1 hypothetical protein [Anaerobacillus isosaccharinicus]QOY37081.1 hypothetical protein AWH56_005415 [Anaerobacillus isosaccharinicus]